MTKILYKQCYLQSVEMENETPWETISLIELKDLHPLKSSYILSQYKITREFKIITIYPQIIKREITKKPSK